MEFVVSWLSKVSLVFVIIRRLYLVYKWLLFYFVVGVKMLNRWVNVDRKFKGYINDGVF